MKTSIRWLWGNYIEPEWKLSRQEVRDVHRLVKQQYLHPGVLFGLTAVWLVVIWGCLAVSQDVVAKWMAGLGVPLAWGVSMLCIVLPLIGLGVWSFRFVYIRPVRRAMGDLGYDVCVRCGYWLRGLGDEQILRCPECGNDVVTSADTDRSSP